MKFRFNYLLLTLLVLATLSACKQEPIATCDDGIQNGDETAVDCGGTCNACPPAERYAIFAVTNSSDGSGFLVPFDELPSGEVDINDHIASGIQLASTRFAGISHNGAVYAPNNPFGDPGVQKFVYDEITGSMKEAGFIPNGALSNASGKIFGFASATKGYYTNHELNTKAIQVFDTESMTRTGEIDCSAAIDEIIAQMASYNADSIATTSIGGFMLERDGKVFTQVFFTDGAGNEVVDSTFVAVIDVATDKLDKIIQWDDFLRVGYYSCINCNYATLGDDNNIYLASFIGNFTDPEGPNYRAIRIKSGETEFDTSWDINGQRDFPNGETFALGSQVKDGKMYVKMFDVTVDATFAAAREKRYYAYEIDLASKTPRIIDGIPAAYWKSIHGPAIYSNEGDGGDGKVYFVVEVADDNNPDDPEHGKLYYYSYDPISGTSKLETTILNGQSQNIVKF
ncbi:MAG: hypothetical protein AAF927_26570 [Bacteroidota bacterium]